MFEGSPGKRNDDEHEMFPALTDGVLRRRSSQIPETSNSTEKMCDWTSAGAVITRGEKENPQFLLVRSKKGRKGYEGPMVHGHEHFALTSLSLKEDLSNHIELDLQGGLLTEVPSGRHAYDNPCKRGDGEVHAWRLYTTHMESNQDARTDKHGTLNFKWSTRDQIKALVEKTKKWYADGKPKKMINRLEPIWVVHFHNIGMLGRDSDISWLDDIKEIPWHTD